MAVPNAQPGISLHKQALRLGALALALVGLPGCQSIAGTGTAGASGNNVAELRVINASPDPTLPGLDFYLNNTALAYNVGYGTISSYIPVAPGSYTISADGDGTRQALVSGAATLVNAHTYTTLIGNELANLSQTVLQDQSTPAPSGEVSFRFIDQASKVGAVDIYLIPTGSTLITTLPFLTDVTFGTNTGYLSIPANTYTISMVPTGTAPIATTVTLFTGTQKAYASGAVRTVIMVDQQVTTVPGLQVIYASDVD